MGHLAVLGLGVVLVGVTAGVAVAQQASCIRWIEQPPQFFQPRHYFAMAYDSLRERAVIFGGRTGPDSWEVVGDTWEWIDPFWAPRSVSGPPARWSSAMVFDSTRGVCVLFGGAMPGPVGLGSDTWEWDGSVWVQRAPVVSPPPRNYHAMAFDDVRNRVVLFGGGNPLRNDTWEWDGEVWTEAHPGLSPSPRAETAMTFDHARGVVVLVGGQDSTGQRLNDTWEWDGQTWTLRAIGPLPGRAAAGLCYDTHRHRVICFAGDTGLGGNALQDTWEWDGATWRELAAGGPSAGEHGAVYDDVSQRVLTVRGRIGGGGLSSDTWVLGFPTSPCVADYNLSGCISTQDLFDFLAGFFSMDSRADVNGSGAVTAQDIFDFLAAWFGGCV